MNPNIFDAQMTRMKSVFGEKSYPPDRIKLFWREVKDLDESFFVHSVDELIGSAKFPPLLPDFREIAAKFREANSRRVKSVQAETILVVEEKVSCTQCEDSGLIFKSPIPGSEYVYKCTCKTGMTRRERYGFA